MVTSTAPPLTPPSFSIFRLGFCLLLAVACLSSGSLARGETRHPHIRRVSALSDPDASNPRARNQAAASIHDQKWKRAASKDSEDDDSDSTETETSTKTGSKSKNTATVTTLTISISESTSTADVTASPLPEAFDGTLDAELNSEASSNCPAFLDGVLADPSYEACYPLSMMLQALTKPKTSQEFFNAQKQLLSIVRVLDATCSANVTYCTEFFDAAAANLTAEENCKKEWNDGDSVVKQFLFGLQAYEMMYQATCLQDPDDDMYCYANAVTNLTTASNAYFYYLPYNLTLPGSTVPACSWCVQETMSIFHSASADRSQPISNTYEAAARQVNTICGLDFVNGTLPAAEVSASFVFRPSWTALITSLVGAAVINTLL
ncbi:hypothetical protein AK830_g3062 [Neonectria ditissima]|uniref:DUF7729 domain-containing protein n=1 Tax=Neonectria ditissima TaxID=78410 RepID=A0A0P7BRV4_9HYPO|nr:hypothetical protein AK830_g3062 [Neonectria ditissima]